MKVDRENSLKSPIVWLGGKFKIRDKIIEKIPDHKCYIEIFGGAGWVLFGKPESKSEVYNDIHDALTNFFRVIKYRPSEFIERFGWLLPSRDLYNEWHDNHAEPIDEVERAARFYYKLRLSYGSNDLSKSFRTDTERKANIDISGLHECILPIHKRLARVKIERLDFAKIIELYDRQHSFFYIDPPYFLPARIYKHTFKPEDFERLGDCLRNLKGKFLMTINDSLEMRFLFKDYNIEGFEISKYSFSGKRGSELFISNY